MSHLSYWQNTIFNSTLKFSSRCNKVYKYQVRNQPVYSRFISAFGLKPGIEPDINEIPLLPIRAFKDAELCVTGIDPSITFKSSGTGNLERSRHHLADPDLYKTAIKNEFYRHFPKDRFSILCYTPGYSENPESSLVWMLNELILSDPTGLSKFLPLDKPLLQSEIQPIINDGQKLILFGAAFGLIDLIESGSEKLPEGSQIIETGGMKTHKRAIDKRELRQRLSDGFGVTQHQIHSEYGMCELLSQMYSIGTENFTSPDWVMVTIRDPKNPFRICKPGEEGKIGIIDLANVYSCPFLLTDDRGVMNKDGSFRVLGRWNEQDPRGCNFLIERE